jgi:hypothetical protein
VFENQLVDTYIEKILGEGAEEVTIGRDGEDFVVRCWNRQWIGGAAGREGRAPTLEEATKRAWAALTHQPVD